MRIHVISGSEVRQLLSLEACIPLMRKAMIAVARDETVQPVRQVMRLPGGGGILALMPGWTAELPCFGLKAVTVFASKTEAGHTSHQGMVLLCEVENGRPAAVIEAEAITSIRTAAATAVATEALARADARSLAICGCGTQAREHLAALISIRSFSDLMVWGRNDAVAKRFAEEQAASLHRPVRAVALETALSADVICTVTSAAEPFLAGQRLSEGQHINLIGSSVPTTAEADEEAVARSRYFVDYRPSALALGGEFQRAKAAGLVTDDHIVGTVGDVLIGAVAGRCSDEDITMFKSLGMAAEDLVAATFVLDEARRRNAGRVVEW